MAVIELNNISKSFGAVDVIKGVDIHIKNGEFAVFVGPSGCGKSTLLRMIAGLETPTNGDFLLDGKRMNDIAPDKRGIAMVFQSYALYPHMTVAENMSFSLELKKLSKAEIAREVGEVAEKLQISDLLDRKPSELSGGQRQRVAIGRAIVKKPSVILFDEPLSNLDASLRVQMRSELQRLHASLGATIVYVTHDQVEAMTMADKIVILNNGYVEQAAPPLELYKKPANAFVAQFIGSPRMNILDATIQYKPGSESQKVAVINDTYSVPVPNAAGLRVGDPVKIGFRPEHVASIDDEVGISMNVIGIERMGSETYLSFGDESNPIIARLNGDIATRIGEPVQISLDEEHLHFFGKSGKSIR